MKYKDPVTGEMKTLSVKAADTLPIGTEVDYDGDTVPDGWEQIIEPGSYAIFGLGASVEFTNVNEWLTIDFTEKVRNGGDLFVEKTTDQTGFKIVSDVKRIRIKVQLCFYKNPEIVWVMGDIKINNSQVAKTIVSGDQQSSVAWSELLLDTIVDVNKDDIIKVDLLKDKSGTVTLQRLVNGGTNQLFGPGNVCNIMFEVIE